MTDTSRPRTPPEPAQTLLSDWRAWPFALAETRLTVRLDGAATRVSAALDLTAREAGADLVLDCGTGVDVTAIAIDGRPARATRGAESLTIPAAALPAGPFTLTTESVIDPDANTTCEGLYRSGGLYCTQCEAEGFRHITPYPDRPDVMAAFRVRIEGDAPVLLSNGNPVGSGPGWAEWHDPWPKPSYLFALVAGDLVPVRGAFTTRSGRAVDLAVWVRDGDQDRAGHALASLGRAMRWDEDAWGREYDLDVFNIVAVDDFNMGAMENKGLNIFNAKLVLASPDTATDADHERIEAVVAHEYFHNWTGNRITCRDWFQLCLKEGLTVWRDQRFTSDLRSAAVKRIEDVRTLRARQFPEDAGPLAHPPRPDRYAEINNFYTATVYEKGAEIVGMLRTLLGEDAFRRGMDLYFDRHDGDAATIEDWLAVFEDASGADLTAFKRWYNEAGTPRLTLTEAWDPGAAGGRLTLTLAQDRDPPRVIPVAMGLIGPNGDEVLPTTLLTLDEAARDWTFDGLGARPAVSLLRGFSAPVTVAREQDDAQRAHLLAHDTDPVARWQAGHDLALAALMARATGSAGGAALAQAWGPLLAGAAAGPAFAALALALPSEEAVAAALAGAGAVPDPDAIHAAREGLATDLAHAHEAVLGDLYGSMTTPGPYRPEPPDTDRRALRGAALALLSRVDGGARARALAADPGCMTDRLAAIAALVPLGQADGPFAAMEAAFPGNRLVADTVFALWPARARPAEAVGVARRLAARPDFDWQNPNRFRALIGGLSANPAAFHAPDGTGYAFTADWLIRMDAVNPQTAARLMAAFETWPRHDAARRDAACAALERIAAAPGLSRNGREMVARLMGAGG